MPLNHLQGTLPSSPTVKTWYRTGNPGNCEGAFLLKTTAFNADAVITFGQEPDYGDGGLDAYY